ncbi:Cytochrome P450 monooxygenase eqxH [Colletotrichum sidae]|uniref:Cytochrome P450 monooxygenase eqxH n=1 Tax=Colletotrichum sidae TaxID=1347389 RepID=A0A4R8SM46_9PEZI|nr:Cytochrome P450 monooxygenase eqxH [Colletotrichum sidae]
MEAIDTPEHLLSSWSDSPLIRNVNVFTTVCIGVVLLLALTALPHMRESSKLPYINPRRSLDVFRKNQKLDFLLNARKLMETARERFPGQPYRLMTDVGETVVLPPAFINEIRNQPDLSFVKAFAENFHPQLPGFEGFAAGSREDGLFQLVIKKRITKLLNQITEPLAAEAQHAIDINFGKPTEWTEHAIKPTILDVVSRLSSRVFLGTELCRHEPWLSITKSYTVNAFVSAELLRPYPYHLRSVAQHFLPQCRTLRRQVAEARRIIAPVLDQRRALRARARAAGEPVPKFNDGLDWFEEESKGQAYDAADAQLGLSVVAIHTTTDLLVETMLRIAQHPHLFAALRREVVDVLSADGWKKTALFNMKLMDSVLKEAQRLKPITSAVMMRVATKPTTLPAGITLRAGDRCAADLGGMLDPAVYPSPTTFDGRRFLAMRGDGALDSQAHLVSTSPSHLGFGHGLHACPGRFFAANELKIALAHLVIKYDWKLTEGYEHRWEEYGFGWNSDSGAKLLMRRRVPEIDIDAL